MSGFAGASVNNSHKVGGDYDAVLAVGGVVLAHKMLFNDIHFLEGPFLPFLPNPRGWKLGLNDFLFLFGSLFSCFSLLTGVLPMAFES